MITSAVGAPSSPSPSSSSLTAAGSSAARRVGVGGDDGHGGGGVLRLLLALDDRVDPAHDVAVVVGLDGGEGQRLAGRVGEWTELDVEQLELAGAIVPPSQAMLATTSDTSPSSPATGSSSVRVVTVGTQSPTARGRANGMTTSSGRATSTLVVDASAVSFGTWKWRMAKAPAGCSSLSIVTWADAVAVERPTTATTIVAAVSARVVGFGRARGWRRFMPALVVGRRRMVPARVTVVARTGPGEGPSLAWTS